MTTLTRPRARAGNGGIPARRAVFRWGWRLFRREWRQQLLVLGLLTVAVAATAWGASVVTNTQLRNPNYPTFGTAAAKVALPGSDPQLAADIATIQRQWGPADLIETESTTSRSVQLRAETPNGHYNSPLLSLVSGRYPAGPGQVALTSQAATLYDAHVGGSWQAAGTTWRVTGIVQDPSNLADEFALVAPGQVTHPSQVILLLGSTAARQAAGNDNGALPGIPAAAVSTPNEQAGGISPAIPILLVEAVGLVFIGLVSVASFSVMAQRRLRALGMLSAIGATGRHLRLVMVVNGLVVGVTAAVAGAVLGVAAWLAYVPTLQQATGHVIDAARLPWWAIAIGVVFAIATSMLASRRPARTMAAVPVMAALSGRPAPPRLVHRSVLPGVIVFAIGLACLGLSGGWSAAAHGNGALFLLVGLVAVIIGIVLLASPFIIVLSAGARPRLPVAIRIALRDLVRYRARSGAALAATTFAVFLAMTICVVTSVRFESPLSLIGPNLSSSQLIIYPQQSPSNGMMQQVTGAQLTSLSERVNSLAASLHAQPVPLESAVSLYQTGTPMPANFTGGVYVATPQLLALYAIKASQIKPGTDVLTARPGLASLRHMEMLFPKACTGTCFATPNPGAVGGPPCTLSNQCVASPTMQTIGSLPSGTSAPNTVITEYAMNKYHLQADLQGWLIQVPAPLTAAQISAARQVAAAYQVAFEIKTYSRDAAEFADAGTGLGIVIALTVLAMSVGLIRSETARDLRTLTATGASRRVRRVITATTAAALGVLGAILGMAGAVIAGLVWAHGSLSATFGDVPLSDALILLLGLPLVAAACGWLLAGRDPEVIARQPLD
jgi:putative ABC transport system permease protein